MKPYLSIVVPAYNEEKRLGRSISKIIDYFGTRIEYEIIIVNDGSTDSTVKVARGFMDRHRNITLLNNPGNKGKGYSVRNGVLHTKGSLVLFTDADLSTPINEYEKLKRWYDKGYPFCIGSRRLKESILKIKQPVHRQLLGRIFGLIVQLLAVGGIQDTQCGFKLYNGEEAKKIFRKQKIDGFSFDAEILYLAKKKGIKIKEVPVIWEDSPRYSKVNVAKESFNMLIDTLKIRIIHMW